MNPLGIYVHIPFCATKCPYCDFYSVGYKSDVAKKYIDAVICDMQSFENDIFACKNTADTLYFGGGTPSILPPYEIARVIETAQKCLHFAGNITLEANPNSVNAQKLLDYKNMGINRISFGMQSANEDELAALGRHHTNFQVEQAVQNSVVAGINDISLDVMLGTPNQTLSSLKATLEFMTALPITHISAYMLSVEKNTPYYNSPLLKLCANEDTLSEMYLFAVEFLREKGFVQYEISNFCKSGYESQHNLKYWQGKEYIGFGAAAYSFYDGCRFYQKSDIENYINTGGKEKIVDEKIVDEKEKSEEYILLGLRLCAGINFDILKEKFDIEQEHFLKITKKFVNAKLCVATNTSFSLTPKGFLLSNSIIAEILASI